MRRHTEDTRVTFKIWREEKKTRNCSRRSTKSRFLVNGNAKREDDEKRVEWSAPSYQLTPTCSRPTTKDGHCCAGGSLRALPLLIDNVFLFPLCCNSPTLSLSILLFLLHFSLSYTLLPGESDGGLVPRYTRRSRPAGTLPSCPSLRTCARDQSMEGLRKRFDGVQTGDTGSFSQTSLTGRRPGRSISSSNIFVYPVSIYYPSVRPSSFDDGFDKTKRRSRRARRPATREGEIQQDVQLEKRGLPPVNSNNENKQASRRTNGPQRKYMLS